MTWSPRRWRRWFVCVLRLISLPSTWTCPCRWDGRFLWSGYVYNSIWTTWRRSRRVSSGFPWSETCYRSFGTAAPKGRFRDHCPGWECTRWFRSDPRSQLYHCVTNSIYTVKHQSTNKPKTKKQLSVIEVFSIVYTTAYLRWHHSVRVNQARWGRKARFLFLIFIQAARRYGHLLRSLHSRIIGLKPPRKVDLLAVVVQYERQPILLLIYDGR